MQKVNPLPPEQLIKYRNKIDNLRRDMTQAVWVTPLIDKHEVATIYAYNIMTIYTLMCPHIDPKALSWGDLSHLKTVSIPKSEAFTRMFNNRVYND